MPDLTPDALDRMEADAKRGAVGWPDVIALVVAVRLLTEERDRAMRFLMVQTEAFAKCQTERDRLREAARVTIAGEHTSVTIRERLKAALGEGTS